jgi:hypothetical protein
MSKVANARSFIQVSRAAEGAVECDLDCLQFYLQQLCVETVSGLNAAEIR